MYENDHGNITLTRGDSLHIPVKAKGYELGPDDVVEMTVRTGTDIGADVLFHIIADADHILHIRPGHTGDLEYGRYKYDIQATLANGDVATYGPYTFKIAKEVTYQ